MTDNLSENADDVFKDYLRGILQRFTDKEGIVQEASCTSFSMMISVNKEKLNPFLFDIFRVIINLTKN